MTTAQHAMTATTEAQRPLMHIGEGIYIALDTILSVRISEHAPHVAGYTPYAEISTPERITSDQENEKPAFLNCCYIVRAPQRVALLHRWCNQQVEIDLDAYDG